MRSVRSVRSLRSLRSLRAFRAFRSVRSPRSVRSLRSVRSVRAETKGTKEKRGVIKPSWRGIATDYLADTEGGRCNSVAIYLCVTTLLILVLSYVPLVS